MNKIKDRLSQMMAFYASLPHYGKAALVRCTTPKEYGQYLLQKRKGRKKK